MIPSPIQTNNPVLRDVMMAKMMSDLIKIQKESAATYREVLTKATELADYAAAIQNLPPGEPGVSIKGDKGDPGSPAEVPEINYDYIISEVLDNMPVPKDGESPDVNEVVSRVLAAMPAPKVAKVDEGKIIDKVLRLIPKTAAIEVPKIDIEELTTAVLELIKKDKRLTPEHINGLQGQIDSYRSQLAGKRYGKETWARGGGDTVAAGTNVTIVTNANGVKVISAGGSSPTTIPVYNEVLAGAGTSWTLAHTPSTNSVELFANGQRLTPTVDFSISGTTITTVNSWVAGTVVADYTYAGSGSATTPTDNEVVSGSGTSWTLAATPTLGSERLYANGQRLTPTVDYSITGAAITTTLSWVAGTILADYTT